MARRREGINPLPYKEKLSASICVICVICGQIPELTLELLRVAIVETGGVLIGAGEGENL